MDRERQIEQASLDYFNNMHDVIESDVCVAFTNGAKWADEHPLCQWNDLDVLPEPDDDIIISKMSTDGKNRKRFYFWWKGKMLIDSINNGNNHCDRWLKIPEIKREK